MMTQFIAIASEFAQSLFEVHDALRERDAKKHVDSSAQALSQPVLKKSFVAKALFVGSVFFLNMYSLGNSLAVWIATLMSKPHSAALVAAACPPIINIVVFAATGLYSLAVLARAMKQKNPHVNEDSDAYKDWQIQHTLRKAALRSAAITSLFFLISSLMPLPGLTNYIGLGLSLTLIAIDVVRLALYGRSSARSATPSPGLSVGAGSVTGPIQAPSPSPSPSSTATQNISSPMTSQSLSSGAAKVHRENLWQRIKKVFSK